MSVLCGMTTLREISAVFNNELARDATDVKLEIVDSTGKVVWTGPAPDKTTGIHDFQWDGKSTSGAQLPDGGVTFGSGKSLRYAWPAGLSRSAGMRLPGNG